MLTRISTTHGGEGISPAEVRRSGRRASGVGTAQGWNSAGAGGRHSHGWPRPCGFSPARRVGFFAFATPPDASLNLGRYSLANLLWNCSDEHVSIQSRYRLRVTHLRHRAKQCVVADHSFGFQLVQQLCQLFHSRTLSGPCWPGQPLSWCSWHRATRRHHSGGSGSSKRGLHRETFSHGHCGDATPWRNGATP